MSSTRSVVNKQVVTIRQLDMEPFGHVFWSRGSIDRLGWIGKEIDLENALGDFGVRKYDDEIGRFLSCDPLWDEADQRQLNVYHYADNNPLSLKDPNGDCPWCLGAIIGAAVEYGSEVVQNYAEGRTGSDAWTGGNVNAAKILVSAAAGALTGGISSFETQAVKASVQVGLKATAAGTISIGETVAHEKIDNKPVTAGKVAASFLLGSASSVGGELAAKVIQKSTNSGKSLAKAADRLENIAKNGRARQAQTARAVTARAVANQFGKGNVAQTVGNVLQKGADALIDNATK